MTPHVNYMKNYNIKAPYILTINFKPVPKYEEKFGNGKNFKSSLSFSLFILFVICGEMTLISSWVYLHKTFCDQPKKRTRLYH